MSIAFNAANSHSFKSMIKIVAAQKDMYRAVSSWHIANTLLDAAYKTTEQKV